MSNRKVPSNDPRYDPSGSSYPSSASGTQRRLVLQQGSGSGVAGLHQPFEPTDQYNQNFSSPAFIQPPLHPQQPQQQMQNHEWYHAEQAQERPMNYGGYPVGNAAATPSMPNEAFPGGRPGQLQIGFSGAQHRSRVQTAERSDRSYAGSFAAERNHRSGVSDEQALDFHRQSAATSSSTPTTKHRFERSLDSEISAPASNERPRQTVSDSQFKQIGIVYSNDETKEFRYECHVRGCEKTRCGRVQELKRHWDSFHENSEIWCPIRGCERSKVVGSRPFPKARKDKLKDHALNAHGIEFEL
ncbi:uncharacterized protein K460DRAFT_418167 [Cucurbitaria berberidis CBS 394.84]|uniref:Uncharacterized protein n=1 Tax=Cucurbitaria berberidis CBS 394.84 TaxID=1168544 RepID=A0A9P4GCF0_9PLEO|nr:uncharacterized protein K460DRAFT_418167 [Cucurbitaria berberidis CBS 394.84]KAF1843030.1 hypothetical protein K460DRAFT_418167 [Cucurbitaria berberidis CBS 394.84]